MDGLQRKLSQISRRLSDYRKRLSEVQERLSAVEQVTLVTQTRELQEDDYYNMVLRSDRDNDDQIYDNLFLHSCQLKAQGGICDLCGVYTIQLQTSSKLPANVFKIRVLMLDVCWIT